ncbi:MAG TPA: MFS transporter [Vitreimonas sp.]|nr:MFS transporter [Vitreimonas sp.]
MTPSAPQTVPSVVRPAIVYVLLYASIGAYFPYIAVFYREIGMSLAAVGGLLALSAAVGLVAAPVWGALADRTRNLAGAIVLAGVWAAVGGAWLGVARDPVVVVMATAVLAAGASGMGPMLDSLTIERLGDRRERYGRARAWGSAAFILGALGTGTLIDRTGAPGLFVVFAPGLLFTSLAAYLLLRGGRSRRRVARLSPLEGVAGILRHPSLSLFLLGSVLVWTSVSAVTTFVSVHLVSLGAEGQVIGALWALGALVEVPLMFLFPILARRIGNERLLVIAAIAFALRSIGWALAGQPLLLLAVAPLGGIGFGLFYVATVGYVARAVPSGVQATAQGVFSGTAFSTGSILGSLIGGQLASAVGLPVLFGVSGIVTGLAGLLVWWAIAAPGGPGRRTGMRPLVHEETVPTPAP